MSIFLKERHLKNAKDMSNLADQYIEAHGCTSITKDIQVLQKTNPTESYFKTHTSASRQQTSSQQTKGNTVWYNCGKFGHCEKL